MTCAGPRTIAAVEAIEFLRADGKPDRDILVTRDCGHTYHHSAPLAADLPRIGDRAMTCLGPDDTIFRRRDADVDPAPGALFVEPKKTTRKARRKDHAA